MSAGNVIKPIRVFIALPLPEAVKVELQNLQRELQGRSQFEIVRWVRMDQMHLTLKFFGHVMPSQVAELEAVLRPICQEMKAFQLHLEQAGCFPDFRNPRVVWIGLAGELEALGQLQERIQQSTKTWGDHQETRAFQPHLTIGRVKSTQAHETRPLGERIRTCGINPAIAWPAGQIDLVQSQLAPQGSQYTVLGSFSLGNTFKKILHL